MHAQPLSAAFLFAAWLDPLLPWACRRVVARRACGQRGARALAAAGELCCERSNPAVQLLFAVLFGGCYWGYCRYVFPLLPLPGVPAWHK